MVLFKWGEIRSDIDGASGLIGDMFDETSFRRVKNNLYKTEIQGPCVSQASGGRNSSAHLNEELKTSLAPPLSSLLCLLHCKVVIQCAFLRLRQGKSYL